MSVKNRHTLAMGIAVLPALACCVIPSALAQPLDGTDVPRDTCILELELPAGARVTIDGRDYGEKRTLTYRSLRAGRRYTSNLHVRFADGAEEKRKLFIEGGRRVRLALASPRAGRPELVTQIGRTPFFDFRSGAMGATAISRDGSYVAFGDSTVSLWDLRTGRRLRTYAVPPTVSTPSITAVAFSPDNRMLAGSAADWIVVWDTVTGRQLQTLDTGTRTRQLPDSRASDTGVLAIAFGRDAGQLVVHRGRTRESLMRVPADADESDRAVRGQPRVETSVWDITRGTKVRTLHRPSDEPLDEPLLASDGSRIALCFYKTVYVWDVRTGERVATLEHATTPALLAFSPDGNRLLARVNRLVRTNDPSFAHLGDLICWDVGEEKPVWSLHLDPRCRVSAAAFSPEGDRILTTQQRRGEASCAFLHDATTGKTLQSLPGVSGRFVEFLPDGRHAFVGDQVVDIETGGVASTFRGASSIVWTVQFTADGRHVLVNNALWSLEEGKQLQSYRGASPSFSPDGRYLATTEGLWECRTGGRVAEFAGHEGEARAISAGPDGWRLISWIWGGSLLLDRSTTVIWDLESGRRLLAIPVQGTLAGLSPDGRRAVVGHSSEIAVWDIDSKRKSLSLSGVRDHDTAVFSPDGRYLATASDAVNRSPDVVLWDATSGRRRRDYEMHQFGVTSLAFSPDGDHLLTTSSDQTAAVWERDTGRRLRSLRGHTAWVRCGAFSPDGRCVLTGSDDGTARLWDLATGEELVQLINTYVDLPPAAEGDVQTEWLVATRHGLFDGSPEGRQTVAYRIGDGLMVVPVDRFFQDFYRPGLLAAIWRGERLLPTAGIGQNAAPLVRIVSPERGGSVDRRQVTMCVEVTDRGGGVKGPWVLQNGARVFTEGHTTRKGGILQRTFQVALIEGVNRLEVRAASEDNSWESEPAVITLSYEQPLEEPGLHLLAVGVNEYAEGAMRLNFAVPDAWAMANLFARRGKVLYGDGKVHVTTLLDQQATTQGIEAAFRKISRKAEPQDTLVVFLAGHGTVLGQRYYFIPHEYRTKAEKLEDDIRQQGLAGDVLGDWLAAVPALKRVVIYDTCQSGGAINIARTARNPFAFRGALERLSRAQGVFTIAATAAGEEAQEVPELRHGVLTYALLAGLGAVDVGPLKRQTVQPQNGNLVDVRDWFSFAQDKVPMLTEYHFGREQFVACSGHGQSFPVLPLGEDGG
jgi:WD40 repeat protein